MEHLPVTRVLSRLVDTLAAGSAVLVAPPGTGKTTLAPPALADAFDGRVVVAEPRRIAARAAARRMADLRGERVGDTVGYSVRGDRKVGPRTRIEVVTTGLLVQRLLADPELAGTGTVMLDECHERHLDTDLALAFLIEARNTIRPDLRLLAASATAEAERFKALLGGEVVEADSPLFPIEVRWIPPGRPMPPPQGTRVDPGFLDHVAAVTARAWRETDGDILVFLPGVGEIRYVGSRLTVPTAVLHGQLPPGQQDEVLTRSAGRRVVLATAVAESSLTVPGVRVVVDSGLARVPRVDHARGLGSLVTVRAAKASTVQRAGRSAREGDGVVFRCWSEADHERRPEQPEPEVRTAELTGFALALACWGHPDGQGLALPDQPPEGAMAVARRTLRALDAVDHDGKVTAKGRRMNRVGAHPRLARALLDGAPLVGARKAAEVVALLAEDAPTGTDDLAHELRHLRPATRAEAERLYRSIDNPVERRTTDDRAAGVVAGLAYPERLARRRDTGYLMAGGTEAELRKGSALEGHRWLAIAAADRPAGSVNARIRLAAAIDEEIARDAGAALLSTVDEVTAGGAKRVERLGAITLSERDIRAPELVERARRERLRKQGLPWTPLRRRMAFLHGALGTPWPEVSDDAVLEHYTDDVDRALQAMLPWPAAKDLETLAPERIRVPSGSLVRVDYTDPERPVLAVKVQEAFGWLETPAVAGTQVLLHLLSPAGRPVAVTRDLASFWRTGYPQVRAELRGRYPRHPWPEDPLTATPTRKTNPRR
ncbi:ATP-dependent helicase HrpB [Dactylosporangium fulvum]|uniref:ATP-dependent helicase HrpB n=1 Tax=Dactylosporangium fulvum TaxID=53359 RepID=A0ABY5VWV4_9ACTN|nr:ATP-dependent helicase HrpB [Dactylosporangium fulvum]UWP81606.1 ATP-dependent helicase HrpB [Dactylosporangium fulvum]